MSAGDITQEALAEAVGVRQQTVSKWLARDSTPRAGRVAIISRELDWPLEEIMASIEEQTAGQADIGEDEAELDRAELKRRLRQALRQAEKEVRRLRGQLDDL